MTKNTKHAISATTHVNKYSVAKGKTFLTESVTQVIRKKLNAVYDSVDAVADLSWKGLPVKGKAICSADDVFNETVGMCIASIRAKRSGTERTIRRIETAIRAIKALEVELAGLKTELIGDSIDFDDALIDLAQ